MADERISIEVTDKVAGSISTKLMEIANAARSAGGAVELLKSELSGLRGGVLSEMKRASEGATVSMAKEALTAQKLATEQERTASASANASNAMNRAAISALRLEQAQNKASVSTSQMEREAERLKRTIDPLYAATASYEQEMERVNMLHKQGAIDASTQAKAHQHLYTEMLAARNAANAMNDGILRVNEGARLNRQHLINLGYQLNDVVVSLASGQKPLTVFIQQGAQIAQIATASGVGLLGMAKAASVMVGKFVPHVALLGMLVGSYISLKRSLSEGAGLEKFSRNLGMTAKQIEELNGDTVIFIDIVKGLWETAKPNDKIITTIKVVFDVFKMVMKDAVKFVFSSIENVIVGFLAGIGASISALIVLFQNSAPKMKNALLDGLSPIAEALHVTLPEKEITQSWGEVGKTTANSFVSNFNKNFNSSKASIEKAVENAIVKPTENFVERASANIQAAAKKRIVEEFNKENEEKVRKDAEDRAKFLAKTTNGLNEQLLSLRNLNGEYVVANEMQKIANAFTERGWKLTEGETKALTAKVQALRDQNASNLIQKSIEGYQQASELSKLSTDQQEVELRLMQKKAEYSKYMTDDVLKTQLEIERGLIVNEIEATKAGSARNKVLDDRTAKLKELISLQNALTAAGSTSGQRKAALNDRNPDMFVGITDFGTASITEKYTEMYAEIDRLRGQDLTKEQATMAVKIQKHRETTELVQQAVSDAQARLDAGVGSFGDSTLTVLDKLKGGFQSLASSITDMAGNALQTLSEGFSNSIGRALVYSEDLGNAMDNLGKQILASLVSSLIQVGVQYAVNAAIGSATTAALTGESIAMAAATAAAWAPAEAAVSLASFGANALPASAAIAETHSLSAAFASAMGGFKEGGYTGNYGTSQIAGVVHGQEFVVNANATARNRSTLEAMNRGASPSQSKIQVNIENYGTSKDFDVQLTENDVRIIARDVVRKEAPNVVSSQVRDPNSPVSKSLSQHTKTERRR